MPLFPIKVTVGCTPPPGWGTGIAVHFDAGNIGQSNSDVAIIPANLARGGEAIEEADCAAGVPCQFPGYRGVVGWKTGFQYYKDAASDPDPADLQTPPARRAALGRRGRRVRAELRPETFDRNRKDMFHYFLFAHALGIPSALACLKAGGTQVDANPDGSCTPNTPNPDFHVPSEEWGCRRQARG